MAEPVPQVYMTELSKPTAVLTTVKVENTNSGTVGDYNTYTAYDDYIDKATANKQLNNYMDVENKKTDVEIYLADEYLDKIAANELGWSLYTKVSHKDNYYTYEVYAGVVMPVPDAAESEGEPEQMQVYAKFDVTEEGKVYLTLSGKELQSFSQIKPLTINIKNGE
ncbi:MAG: hypothetical protein IJM59_11245 [Proteobacteria bacterium]|nr:hypothetical protein [Pseudomonadota bacterium]